MSTILIHDTPSKRIEREEDLGEGELILWWVNLVGITVWCYHDDTISTEDHTHYIIYINPSLIDDY